MPSAASVLAALTLGLGGAVEARAALRERRAERDFPPLGRLLDVNGRRVHAVTEGAGPDLVLIHGASGNLRDFTFGLVPRLARRWRVTAFDRPGMGYSENLRPTAGAFVGGEPESPAEQAAQLRAAARALGLGRPVVLGFSYGAAVALAWGLDDPEGTAAVVNLSGASMPWGGSLSRLYRINASRLGGALVPPVLTAFVPQRVIDASIAGTFFPDAPPPGYAYHIGAGLTTRRRALRSNARQVAALDRHLAAMAPRYPSLRPPLEIVHGDGDPIVPLEGHSVPLAQAVPGSALRVLPGVGHMPHHVAPDAVEAAVERAFARAERA